MREEILKEISINKIGKDECIPFELLLDADPSMTAIAKYLPLSEVYVAELRKKTVAVMVLFPLEKDVVEIKNIAVESSLQGNGIGKLLLETATQIAIGKKIKAIVIGTSNSSIDQLFLYQKCGFEITSIRHNFFVDNYAEQIFENGIQCKHMIVLTKTLN